MRKSLVETGCDPFREHGFHLGVLGGVSMQPANEDEITQWLCGLEARDPGVTPRLFSLLYPRLKKIASGELRGREETLRPTALVNELFLRMEKRDRWNCRAHFLAVATKAMRSIIVDHVRAKRARKRTLNGERVALECLVARVERGGLDVLELDEALNRLQVRDPSAAKIVEGLWFGGLTMREVSAVLGIPLRSAERTWSFARAWLLREMRDD